MRTPRALTAAAVGTIALATPATAPAAIGSVFLSQTVGGAAVSCSAQSDGVRVCHGASGMGSADTRLKSFDGSPLSFYVILPPSPSGSDGNYPLVVQSHGWGGSAGGPGDTQYYGPTGDALAKQGYAVLQLTARGFGDSCGSSASRLQNPMACQNGYIRLDDERYEVRDIQYATGLLVDEGVVDPSKIGLTGESYGGGVSLELATLKDRVMNTDGTLSPWRSPGGTPLHIAAAAPVIPWSDLVNSLVQNGHTLDYQIASPTTDLSPVGVLKQSFVAGLFALGGATGYYSPPGTNSESDLGTWYAATNAGEPYDTNPIDQTIVDEIARYHSAYYLLDGKYGATKEQPPPLLIANGFTDDLFPVDEAVRYYNLDRSLYPDAGISLFDWDGGHMRGQDKKADKLVLSGTIQRFLDYYLKGIGQPPSGATALTQTCPSSAASGGPFAAESWNALHPGEVDYISKGSKTVSSSAGDPTISKTVDPVAGDGACATVSATDQGSGIATYRLPAATGEGYTLLGAPTVIASLNPTGQFPFIAARLWDVDPVKNTETLVARGVYRLGSSPSNGLTVFQLHPGAWHFAAGHIPKLELLGQDSPYARTSNGQFSISVSGLELRIPVHEKPDSPGTPAIVSVPRPPVTTGTRCRALPSSRIDARHTHGSRRGLRVSGTAGEPRCAHASAAAQRGQRVIRVYLWAYQARHGRCWFLTSSGKLSRPRSCSRPIRVAATGTTRWTLRLVMPIPAGRYRIRSDAVDGFHHHQRPSGASVTTLTIR